MKKYKWLYFVIPVGFLFILAELALPFAVVQLKKQLLTTFPGSAVAAQGCHWASLKNFVCSGIAVQKEKTVELKIKELSAQYDLLGIIRGKIKSVTIVDADFLVNLPAKGIAELNPAVFSLPTTQQKSFFSIKKLKFENAKVALKLKEIKEESTSTIEIDLEQQIVNSLNIQMKSFEYGPIMLKNASLVADQLKPGTLHIETISLNKLKVADLRCRIQLQGKNMLGDLVESRTLGGIVSGQFSFDISPYTNYQMSLQLSELKIEQLVQDFDLKKKFDMTGSLSGRMVLDGQGADVEVLDGSLALKEPGGVLTIYDTAFLKNISSATGLPEELLVASYKNYNYNAGIVKVSLEDGNAVLDAALDGESGKRNLHIVFHDLF